MSVATSYGQLNGNYTIGSGVPTATNYVTIGDAVSDLLTGVRSDAGPPNGPGISANVVFDIVPGAYNEQVRITEVVGVSSTDTIIFQSQTGNAADVQLTWLPGGAGDNYILWLDSADYITFQNVSFVTQDPVFARGVVLSNKASNNNLIGNNFLGAAGATTTDAALVFHDQNAIGVEFNCDTNRILNNTFTDGAYGIYWRAYMLSGARAENNFIQGNNIINAELTAIHFVGPRDLRVDNNIIATTTSVSNVKGIYISQGYNSLYVVGNGVLTQNSNGAIGIDINNCSSTGSPTQIVANNMVVVNEANTSYGIYVYNNGAFQIYHNSVNLIGAGAAAGEAFHEHSGSTGQGDALFNNIFANGGGGEAIYVRTNGNFTGGIDYNDYFTTGANIGSWGGGSVPNTIADWQAATGQDANSLAINPNFASATDPHLTAATPISLQSGLNLIAQVPDDVDGDVRGAIPWFGADENNFAGCDYLTVSNTLDDGSCGSLRGAINYANLNIGPDTITFNTAVMGSNTIQIFSTLPVITDDHTVIDGDSDGDCVPEVIIDGIGGAYDGFEIQSDSNTIHGLNIQNCTGNSNSGIFINGGDYNFITCNHLGTNLGGTATAFGNDFGVSISNGGFGNIIGDTTDGTMGNVISGNLEEAVLVQGASNNYISGNIIGGDITGNNFLGNTGDGIMLLTSADNNIIGGTNPGTGNVVMGSTLNGIYIGGSVNNQILGNYIGLEITGSFAGFGNGDNGIEIDNADNNFIGDGSVAGRNIISGNSNYGIYLNGSDFCQILNNYVGTDVTGMIDIGNSSHGITIDGSDNNLVGDNTGTTGNLISGNNACGIQFNIANDNEVYGNLIGTDATGLAPLMNSWRGIRGVNASTGNIIGAAGVTPNVVSGNFHSGIESNGGFNTVTIQNNYIGVGIDGVTPLPNNRAGVMLDAGNNYTISDNVIAYNNWSGIDVRSTSNGNMFNINSIYSNVLNGVDFTAAGVQGSVTPPVINSIYMSGTDTIAEGTADNGANVYLYCDSTHEGQIYLGSTVAAGDGSWSLNINGYNAQIANGIDSVTAIQESGGNSSEFSNPVYKMPSFVCDTSTVVGTWTWNGSVSIDWFDCGNWTAPAAAVGTLPGSNADVVIPGGTPFEPTITGAAAYCNSIQINSSAGALLTLDTPGGGSLNINP